MKNKMYTLLVIGVCAMCLIFTLSACDKSDKIKCITDFSKYSSMTRKTDRIEVSFDRNTDTPFCFNIEDKEDIDEIMEIIFSESFEKMCQEVNGGNHTSIKIVQAENEYSIGVMINYEGKNGYTFASTKLQDKIIELAREAGAYDVLE